MRLLVGDDMGGEDPVPAMAADDGASTQTEKRPRRERRRQMPGTAKPITANKFIGSGTKEPIDGAGDDLAKFAASRLKSMVSTVPL